MHAAKVNMPDKGIFVKNKFTPSLDTRSLGREIKEIQHQEIQEKQNKLHVYYQFDEYISNKQRKVSKATLTVYRNVKSILQAFETYRKKRSTLNVLTFPFARILWTT